MCLIWGHSFHNARKPTIWPKNLKLDKGYTLNTKRSHGCLDHCITLRHQNRKYRCRRWVLPHEMWSECSTIKNKINTPPRALTPDPPPLTLGECPHRGDPSPPPLIKLQDDHPINALHIFKKIRTKLQLWCRQASFIKFTHIKQHTQMFNCLIY